MKVLTFSKTFPAYHPKAGQPTLFIEKIWSSIGKPDNAMKDFPIEWATYAGYEEFCFMGLMEKKHTIRAGFHWKTGDWFSPRVWSGKPYKSKQVTIAPPIQIVKTIPFSIENTSFMSGLKLLSDETIERIANNDGLELQDFMDWFQHPKPFDGQIICWKEIIY